MKLRLTACLFLVLSATFARAEPTNILLITADDLGLQLSCYGDPYITTPNLDALAAEGVKFRTAYVAQASCSPSRSTMLSGLFPHTTGQIGLANGGFTLNPSQIGKNLPAYLKSAGYRTGILGKLHVAPENSFPFDYRPKKGDTRDVRALAENAATFLSDDAADRPFFLMVNYADPHFYKDPKTQRPIFPSQWKGLPRDPIADDAVPGWDFQGIDEPIARKRVSNFYNTVKRLDIGVGLLLEELEEAGHAGNTLVIFLGDHGPPFNRGKTTCYESGLRVPFLVRWPGVSAAGIESPALVSSADIVPTILDAAKVEFPREFHGSSLRPALASAHVPPGWRDTLVGEFHYHGYSGFFPQRAIRDQRYKLIHSLLAGKAKPLNRVDGDPTGPFAETGKYRDTPAGAAIRRWQNPPEYQLYDLQTDPVEFINLADDPGHAETLKRLKASLLDWRRQTADPLLLVDGMEKFRASGKAAENRIKNAK